MADSPRVSNLARCLLQAGDGRAAFRVWLEALGPCADVAVLVDGEPAAALAFRADGEGWVPLSLPPVAASAHAGEPAERSLAARRDALDDVLAGLGIGRVLERPLDPPEAGTLLLGWSAAEPVSEALRSRVDEALPLLGPGLRAGTTRAHVRREASDDAGEVAELFSLTRALASSIEVADALEAARGCLDALLRPDAGGVRLAVENDGRFVWHVWPEDEPREPMAARLESAAARAASSGLVMPLTDSSGRTWLCSGSGETASIAVAFRGPPPVDKGSRVLPAVCASLSLACDRFRAQRSREDSRLEAALDGIPVGIVLTDAVGRIRLANPVGERLLRAFTAWPGTGEPLTRLGAVDVTSWFSQGDEPHEMEIREPEGGRTVVVRLFPASPLADAEAKGDRVLVLEDVTESRRHKRQMLQAEKLSSLGILISGIVHEINNPLATILGYAQMLRREPRSQAETRWIERLFEEAKRCQTIVRDMLDTARPKESGRRAVAVPPVVEKALGLMAHPLRAAGIETVVHARPDVAPVHVEPDALLRVVLNLLTNALHALEEHSGQRRIEIAVRPAPETGRVEISVGDSGPGIRPEHQDKIFDPFFTTKAEGKGSGLGLSLVEATVREHGGSLEVDSAPGRGARFTFSLPAAATPEGSAEGRALLPAARLGGLEGRRVLVAEDEASVGEMLAEILEAAGAATTVVGDGQSALRALTEGSYDALICDLAMPRVGGDKLLAMLREERPELAARVVFVTGDGRGSEPAGKTLRHGRPCLGKPFDIEVVLETVRRTCARGSEAAAPPSSAFSSRGPSARADH